MLKKKKLSAEGSGIRLHFPVLNEGKQLGPLLHQGQLLRVRMKLRQKGQAEET